MLQKNFNIVLFQPEIPGNTGSIGRTCVALEIPLILIKPYGFDINEKAVRRAGLDYWKHLNLIEYENWEEFLRDYTNSNLLFFDNFTEKNYDQAPYLDNCCLIFGSETKGFPEKFYKDYIDKMYKLPMFSEKIRSLNLSNAATAITYECLRQINMP